jgi:DeoR family transcriptional regulator of aga operon
MHSLRGHLTEDAMRDVRADTVFMGASAIDLERGFLTEHIREIAVDRALRAMARDAVILADASEFDRVAPGFMFGFQQASTLVTDERVRPEHVQALAIRGTRVVTAKGGAASQAR